MNKHEPQKPTVTVKRPLYFLPEVAQSTSRGLRGPASATTVAAAERPTDPAASEFPISEQAAAALAKARTAPLGAAEPLQSMPERLAMAH